MSVLEVQGLDKTLGSSKVVNDVNLRIEEGEFFVLLGVSGSGKSTLLRLICGLEKPDRGRVVIGGRDVTTLSPRERNIGMVFQDYGLYPNMDVYHNIAYGLEARNLPRAEVDTRVNKASNMLGLREMLSRSIVDLSGGEQQRVALARAFAKDADAYLFDEPLSNLDPKLRYQARRDIMTLHREKRKPSLYVTHDQVEAFAMATRMGVMANGVIHQIGTVDEILNSPVNLFVARFTGWPPMNLLDGEIRRNGDTIQIAVGNFNVPLPDHWKSVLDSYNKSRVMFGFRPQALLLPRHIEDHQPTQPLSGTVESVEAMIGESVAMIKLNDRTSVSAVFQDDGDIPMEPGSPLDFALDVNQINLFDPDTSRSLTARPVKA
jgi:multiple sugar transport system ATP-binding protein